MIYFCYVVFALGLVSYVLAAINMNSYEGGTYNDIGAALWLLTIILLLLRQAHAKRGNTTSPDA